MDDLTHKLKAYIRELDDKEKEILTAHDGRASGLQQQLGATDEACWRRLAEAVQGLMERKQHAFMQDMHASAVDFEERLLMQNEKLQVEVRMWELREQDLQEQFAFREQQIKLRYEERIQELEAQMQGFGGGFSEGSPSYMVANAPVSLGLDIAEERAQLFLSKESVKTHPGVRVIGVDPSVKDSSISVGDVITKVSFTVPIEGSTDFRRVVSKMTPGDLVMVHIERDGAERVYPIIAGGLPPGELPQ